MNKSIKTIMENLENEPLQYGWEKGDVLLDALYQSYCEGQGCDSDLIRRKFQQLNDVLSELKLRKQDQVINITCDLCSAHHKQAYKAGLLAGFHLFHELSLDIN